MATNGSCSDQVLTALCRLCFVVVAIASLGSGAGMTGTIADLYGNFAGDNNGIRDY